jgi:FtsP/CotA-like multicopper oxidase with cupredoxin domain
VSDGRGRNGVSRLDRRTLLKLGLGTAGAAAAGGLSWSRAALGDGPPPTPIRFTPFTREMPVPPVLTPTTVSATEAFYVVHMKPVDPDSPSAEIIPNVKTKNLVGYEGLYPGPTIRGHMGRADRVRQLNQVTFETSVHQHGGHNAFDSDGFPNDFTFPGGSKDYFYPNEPVGTHEPSGPDPNDNPSFLWYHDHAMDITGPNVYHGLAGFYLMTDDFEDGLISNHTLPSTDFDVPLVLQDRRFNADGSLFYDPFQHDGFLGDVFLANGKAQPFFHVQPRKYRFRVLNGHNARIIMLRLSNNDCFLQVGADSWLLPFAISRGHILLGMAERADVVVDFSGRSGSTIFLENILVQKDGRGPGGDLNNPDTRIPGTQLVKFLVDLPLDTTKPDATLMAGTALRPNTPILEKEIAATRHFEFNRSNGAWQINGRFFDPNRVDAAPALGSAERWFLKNGGGGWWHPIHIHLEAHQVQSFNGRPPALWNSFKKDTTLLGPGDEAEVFMRFRDHGGPFVFHCHNIEHEDMRMMGVFDVK